jgi:hypothetical protein
MPKTLVKAVPNNVIVTCRCIHCGSERNVRERRIKYASNSRCRHCPRHGKHKMSNHPIFKAWTSMRQRCYMSNSPSYEQYGGRGIRVCKRWNNDSIAFIEWSLSNGWKEGLSLDRIDNDGNYTPRNCRWTDRITQSNNKRTNVYVTFRGELLTLKQAANKYAIVSYGTVVDRYRRSGWSLGKSLLTPNERARVRRTVKEQIIDLLGRGWEYRQIQKELGVSSGTVGRVKADWLKGNPNSLPTRKKKAA